MEANDTLETLLTQSRRNRDAGKDVHVIRFYSSYVTISNGKVISATDPSMVYCPLANLLYSGMRRLKNPDTGTRKEAIIKAVEEKISKFGFFTEKRRFDQDAIAVPYGASEILMYAMKKERVDAAVVVCDGAGTVIVDKAEIVQGIGARMNGVFFTSPVFEIMRELKKRGCRIVSERAGIDQIEGVKEAARAGYKNIAVTVNGSMQERLAELEKIEKYYKIRITSLVVCTTGISSKKAQEIEKYADIVWGCASEKVRGIIGPKSILQLSKKIPVFVLTKKGLDLISSYSSDEGAVKNLDLKKQYIITSAREGKRIKMGDFNVCLNMSRLPVRSEKEPG